MAQILGPVFPRAWKAHLLKCREDSSNSREKDEKMCLNTAESTVPLSYVPFKHCGRNWDDASTSFHDGE